MSTIKYWSQDELLRILTEARRESIRNHCIILFAYTFGLRSNEVANVTVQNVQRAAWCARLRRTACLLTP